MRTNRVTFFAALISLATVLYTLLEWRVHFSGLCINCVQSDNANGDNTRIFGDLCRSHPSQSCNLTTVKYLGCSSWNGNDMVSSYIHCLQNYTFGAAFPTAIEDVRLTESTKTPATNPQYKSWAEKHGLAPLKMCRWTPSLFSEQESIIKSISAIHKLEVELPHGGKVQIFTASTAPRHGPTLHLPFTFLTMRHYSDANIAHQFSNSGLPFALQELRNVFFRDEAMNGTLRLLLQGIKFPESASARTWLSRQSPSPPPLSMLNPGQLWSQALAGTLIPLLDNVTTHHTVVVVDALYSIDVSVGKIPFPFQCFVPNMSPLRPLVSLREAFGKSALLHAAAVAKYVLLLHRKPRFLVDAESLRLDTLVSAMQRLGLPVRVLCFADLEPREQMRAIRGAAVLVAVHGAELTNMLFLPPGAVVIEVSLRYGWCCDPVPQANQGLLAPPCQTKPCRPYHKADFANMAQALGLGYHLFDPVYIDPPTSRNPIDRPRVHINATELALLALFASRRGPLGNGAALRPR